jgi:hypothetical protein
VRVRLWIEQQPDEKTGAITGERDAIPRGGRTLMNDALSEACCERFLNSSPSAGRWLNGDAVRYHHAVSRCAQKLRVTLGPCMMPDCMYVYSPAVTAGVLT